MKKKKIHDQGKTIKIKKKDKRIITYYDFDIIIIKKSVLQIYFYFYM